MRSANMVSGSGGRVALSRFRQAYFLGTGRAPAGSPPQESNRQARRPVPAGGLPGGSSLTPSAVLGPTDWGARVLVAGVDRRLPNGGGTGIPRVGCGFERWGVTSLRHRAACLPGRARATRGPGRSGRDSRKGSTGQVPCLDVLVEAAHLASSRPVLNRYLPDTVSVTQSAVVEPSDGRKWRVEIPVGAAQRPPCGSVRDELDNPRQVPHLRRRNCVPIAPKFCALPLWGSWPQGTSFVSAALVPLDRTPTPRSLRGPRWRLSPAQTESEFRE